MLCTIYDIRPTITNRHLISTQIKKQSLVPLSITEFICDISSYPLPISEDMSNGEFEASFTEVLQHFSTLGAELVNYQNIRCSSKDTAPLTFAKMDMTMDKWLSSQRGHHTSRVKVSILHYCHCFFHSLLLVLIRWITF